MPHRPPLLNEICGHTLVLGATRETLALRAIAKQAREQGAALLAIVTPETREDWEWSGLTPLHIASTPEEIDDAVQLLNDRLDDLTPRTQQVVLIVDGLESIPATHQIVKRFLEQDPRSPRHVALGLRQWPLSGPLAGYADKFTSRIVTGQNMDVLRDVLGPEVPFPANWGDWSVQAEPGGEVMTKTTSDVVCPRTGEVY